MRVPIGSSLLVSSTAALPSKRISEPSGRRTPRVVRTTTASYTSPFFTLPRGIASLTLTLMTSPTVAYRRRVPPSTLMHIRVRAPLLSAAFSIVRNWIMIQTCLRRASAMRRLLDHLEQPPRLAPRHRPARGDDHEVTLSGGAVLVVRQQLRRAADVLA